MNALVRKEVRLLLPAWLAGLCVIAAPILGWLVFPTAHPSLFLVLAGGGLMALICALHTFGREFAQHTFSQLLALPVSRARVWWTKIAILVAALTSLYGAWWFAVGYAVQVHPKLEQMLTDLQVTPGTTALAVAVLFTGSLWTTLLLRQVAAALWFVLLLPSTILIAADAALGLVPAPPAAHEAVPAALLGIYSLAGFVLAWRLFLRAEDAQWTGGTIGFPGRRRRAGAWGSGVSSARTRRPVRALLAKELQLHHPTLLIAALVLILHLGVAGVRAAVPALNHHPLVGGFLGAFWGFWLLMPALVNAMAVAEERKLGVLESQLCQPVTRRLRWWTKALTSLALGVALGTLAPCLLENREQLPRFFTDANAVGPLSRFDHVLSVALISFGSGLVSLYASSLARNTLQALGLAGLFGLVGSFIFNVLQYPESFLGRTGWHGSVGVMIAYPALALALFLLAARNAHHLHLPGRRWLDNAAIVAGTFLATGLLASAIYHRSWELFAENDPAHGPRRLQPESSAAFQHDGQLSLRSQTGELTVFPQTFSVRSRGRRNVPIISSTWSVGQVGSNFVSHTSTYFETVAIHRDGTLWVSSAARSPLYRSTDTPEPVAPLDRFDSDTNWTATALDPSSSRGVLLLKSDGTLWRWSLTNHANGITLREDSTPRRLEAGSDWASLITSGRRIFLKARDGVLWAVNNPIRHSLSQRDHVRRLEPGLQLDRIDAPGLNPLEWRSFAWPGGTYDLAIKTDGTLWAIGLLPWDRTRSEARLDPAGDWKSVAANSQQALAVKNDGSLWRIDYRRWDRQPVITRLGQQNDWLAVTAHHDATYALSADGALWAWGGYSYHGLQMEFAPSRVPTKIASLP